MAAEALTGARGASTVQPARHSLSGVMHVAYGYYSVTTAALEANDTFVLCRLPKNCLVVGGNYHVADLDSGTETVDIDLGVQANGGGSATLVDSAGTTWTNAAGSADPDCFVNAGVLTGDAITDLLAAGNNLRPFPMTTGPLYFSEETVVEATVVATQATPVAGVIYCEIRYIVI